MRRILLCAVPLVILAIACEKNSFNTRPSIELKTISRKVVPVPSDADLGNLDIDLEYKDKEGDVNDTLFFIKVRTNQRPVEPLAGRDSLEFIVPDFPKEPQGTINLKLEYQNHLIYGFDQVENDSLQFKFILKDKGGNVSDTLVINDIVIQR